MNAKWTNSTHTRMLFMGNGVTKEDLTFSRKAGCSCGCSAGFVSKMHVMFRGNSISQISVSKIKK